MKIILLSGGQGTRLWPVSTKDNPKQYQKFGMKHSLLQETFNRVSCFGKNNIYVLTLEEQKHLVKKSLPEIKESQIITQPYAQDSAMGIAFTINNLKDIDENETLVFLPSDHEIKPKKKFTDFIKNLETLNQKNSDYLFTVGITPNFPATDFGYIKCEDHKFSFKNKIYSLPVNKFLEKPKLEKAKTLFKEKNIFWNAGFIIGTKKRLKESFLKNAPEILNACKSLDDFKKAPFLSFDYAIWEKETKILCVPSQNLFNWNDIGLWKNVPNAQKNQKIIYLNKKGKKQNKHNNFVYSENKKPVILLDVKDLLVIEGDKGILIAKKGEEKNLKEALKHI
jgi:mannose-1-phosphate guanylyltransferase